MSETSRETIEKKMRILNDEILRQVTASPRRGSPEAIALERATASTRSAARRLRNNDRHEDASANGELEAAAAYLWGPTRPDNWPS